jgi:exosortase A
MSAMLGRLSRGNGGAGVNPGINASVNAAVSAGKSTGANAAAPFAGSLTDSGVDAGVRSNSPSGTMDTGMPAITLAALGSRKMLWICLLLVAAILLAYAGTFASMVKVWSNSETFLHGFIIAPVSLWLIWSRRHGLAAMQPEPDRRGLVALGALGFTWLLATLADVQVVRHFAAVSMIPAVLWTVTGRQMVLRIGFPLAFLMLAVPFGEAFIPTLIDITANATVWALQLTGIPVYREGNSFAIPSGNWSVVEACSGVRYLIASITLGSLYAYLTYRSLTRRLAFMAVSVLLPIVANSVRAYLIVMIGHLSDMTLAVGVDHLIYGWIFFGLVMVLLFWIGTIWREDTDDNSLPAPASQAAATAADMKSVMAVAAGSLVIMLIWPAWAKLAMPGPQADHTGETGQSSAVRSLDFPEHMKQWQRKGAESAWKPIYGGQPLTTQGVFRFGGHEASIHLAHYPMQVPGSGLVMFGNALVKEEDAQWHATKEERRLVSAGNVNIDVRQTSIYGPGVKLLVWRWYQMNNTTYASPYMLKAALALNRLTGRPTAGSEIVLHAPFHERPEEAEASLKAFLPDAAVLLQEGSGHAR